MDYEARYPSFLGTIVLKSDGETLTSVRFEENELEEKEHVELPIFLDAFAWLDRFFSSEDPGPLPKISLSHCSNFRCNVLLCLSKIPYGQKRTYGELAKDVERVMGKKTSPRRIGTALKTNPILLFLPCHRVVGCKGKLGGYVAGAEKKKRLLALEQPRILETERLYLRRLEQKDFLGIYEMLSDPEVMKPYEGPFLEKEAHAWLDRQIDRYKKWGFGWWAVIRKEDDCLIGQCGLTYQPWKGEEILEVGYMFAKEYWDQGYAIEAASACKNHAFDELNAAEVCSIVRDSNFPSQRVALRNGMIKGDSIVKFYRGVSMPHDRYYVTKEKR